MKRTVCLLLAALMTAVLMTAGVSAAEITGCSAWAVKELEEADALGLIPPADVERYWQSGIRREEFAEAAVYYLAAQFGVEPGLLLSAWRDTGAEIEEKPFTDAEGYAVRTAYSLGVIAGRGNGEFDPYSSITREEAAKILCNACLATAALRTDGGGNDKLLPDQTGIASRFSDYAQISSWAQESVAAVSGWGVMNGVSATEFDPKGTYTREQCFVTFLRLWKNAPVSRVRGNVKTLTATRGALDDPADLLGMNAGQIRAKFGNMMMEYSEHGPGAPAYSLEKVPGVLALFLHDSYLPLPDDAVPAVIILNREYGRAWNGIAPGDEIHYRLDYDWTVFDFSPMNGCAYLQRKFDGLVLTCVVADPVPQPDKDLVTRDFVNMEEWSSTYKASGWGTVFQVRIGLAD